MHDLIASGALQIAAVAFGVGIVVGLTGMGGGALMTPALIFLGVPPTIAVANDLVAAALNKSAGAAVHLRQKAPHLALVKWLVVGSVPAALAGVWLVHTLAPSGGQEAAARIAIGCAILLTAATYTMRILLEARCREVDDRLERAPQVRPLPTIVVGGIGGLLVGMTSVGSGSLIMVTLMLLYPALSAATLVGTDLVQAVPLVLAAAIGHVLASGVDWAVLIPLVLGGTPGTMLGARITPFLPPTAMRRGIVLVLSLTGLALLRVPSTAVGIIGVLFLFLALAPWALGRRPLHRTQPRRNAS